MPFYSRVAAGNLLEYLPHMPDALLVAVLDIDMERETRTTAVLSADFIYEDEREGLRITVPASYVTDFASIPAVVRPFIPAFGRHAKAAVIHDWLYAVGEDGRKDAADRIFLHALEELQVGLVSRTFLYQGVHLGGGHGYKHEKTTWDKTFADWRTGKVLPEPPFKREEAFTGKPHGPQPIP